MSDFNPNYPSTETITSLRNTAIFYFVSGIILIVCRYFAGKPVLAVTAGVIICAVGTGWFMANNPVNKKTGAVFIGIGILVIISAVKISILPVITGIAISIISTGFLVMGVKNFVLYISAQNRRN